MLGAGSSSHTDALSHLPAQTRRALCGRSAMNSDAAPMGLSSATLCREDLVLLAFNDGGSACCSGWRTSLVSKALPWNVPEDSCNWVAVEETTDKVMTLLAGHFQR